MRETGSFRKGRPMDSRSRFDDRPRPSGRPNFSNKDRDFQPPKQGNFGNPNFGNDNRKDSESRFANVLGRLGPSSFGAGIQGPTQFSESGPQFGNNGPPSNFGNNGPPSNFGNSGPPSNFGNNGPPANFGNNGPPSNFGNNGPPSDFGNNGPNNFGNNGPNNFQNNGPPNFPNNGPAPYVGNEGLSNFGNNGPSNFGNTGPNYGNNGPGHDMGPMRDQMEPVPQGGGRPPMGPPQPGNSGMRNSNFGNMSNEADLLTSIQTLSQMSSQQKEMATKIISAVLSNNLISNTGNMGNQGPSFEQQGRQNFLGNMGRPNIGSRLGRPFQQGENFMGNMGNQQGRPPLRLRKMGGGGGFGDRKPPFRSRSPHTLSGSRHMASSGGRGGGFNRFTKERAGLSSRASFPGGKGFKSKVDKRTDIGKRLSQKRSWSSSSAKEENLKYKRRRSDSLTGDESPDDMEKTDRDDEDKSSPLKKERSTSPDGEEKDTSNKIEIEAPVEKKDDFPVVALYCHICKHGNFTSVKTYLFHLEGLKHKKTASAFHSKSEITLEYLRKNAKLASVRFGGKDSSVAPFRCSICTAVTRESFLKHKRLLEHRIVKKFMKPNCCGRFFKSRYDMNEHRLSLPHLKKALETKEMESPEMEEYIKGKGPKWTPEEVIQQLKSKNPTQEKHLTLETVPPFDGNTLIGIDMLKTCETLLCKSCHAFLPMGGKKLESHLTSIDHYNMFLDYLRGEKKKKTGSGKKPKKEDDSVDNEDEEYLDASVLRSDDDDDDDDDDAVVVAVKLSDDEEEKDLPYIDEDDHIVLEEIDGEDHLPKEDDANDGNEDDKGEEEGKEGGDHEDEEDDEITTPDFDLIP